MTVEIILTAIGTLAVTITSFIAIINYYMKPLEKINNKLDTLADRIGDIESRLTSAETIVTLLKDKKIQ